MNYLDFMAWQQASDMNTPVPSLFSARPEGSHSVSFQGWPMVFKMKGTCALEAEADVVMA